MRIAEMTPWRIAVLFSLLALSGAPLSLQAAEQAAADSPAATPPSLDSRVNVRIKDASLSVFLDVVSEQAKVKFVLARDVEDTHVTAFLRGVTAKEALDIVLSPYDLEYRKAPNSDVYVVFLKGKGPGVLESGPEAPDPLKTRVRVSVKNAPLATFLDTVSEQAKVNFILKDGLQEYKVTVFLSNVTVEEALDIVAEIKGLTYRRVKNSNNYIVEPKPEAVSTP